MAEATNPSEGVDRSEAGIINRLAVFEVRKDQEQVAAEDEHTSPPAATAPEEPEPQQATPATDELTPEDLPDEDAAPQPSAADEFEIVHNGAQHKLPRAEVIKLAQQGFDYTQKTQALAEYAKGLGTALQRLNELEQIAPLVANERATLQSLQAQLKEYDGVNWVAVATNPETRDMYAAHRARYDQLRDSVAQTSARLTEAEQEIRRRKDEVVSVQIKQELQRLPEFVPEWKDQARYEADSKDVIQWMASQGIDIKQVQPYLDSAFSCSVVYKAMKYDKLLKSKGDKSKLLQQAPPVTRPGIANTPGSAKAEKELKIAKQFKKSGSVEDAAALYLQRMK
jgi:hypothetical protein